MRELQLDVVVTRGQSAESRHKVHAAVVNASGSVVAFANDLELVTHWRSCAKPFQVLHLLESGGFDSLRWGDDQLAISCASHGGEPEHVAIVARMLADLGLEEGDLACGPHEPLATRGVKVLRDAGERPTRLHNNCSGKHSAMLAQALTSGWPTYGYERPEHDVQRHSLRTVSEWTGTPADAIGCSVDGCGVIEYSLPLTNMAAAYARLACAAQEGDESPARVVHALQTRPFLIGGSDRFDSILIEETEGRIVSKVGAEGVHSAMITDRGMGVAIKVEDGAQRAQYPALLRALQLLDALPAQLPPRLEEIAVRPVRNTRGETVGEVRSAA